MNTPQRKIRLTDDQVAALEALGAALGSVGQRGATLNPIIAEVADIAIGAMAETVAALRIARQCAAGGDWDELVEVISPEWPES
jgi:translation initiation factor IF-2